MKSLPNLSDFKDTFSQNKPQIVWTSLVADLETPVSVMLKIAKSRPNSFLLESVEGGAIRGRYSFVGLNPDLIWRCFGNRVEINRTIISKNSTYISCPVGEKLGALESLRSLVAESRIVLPDGMPPMAAGLVGYMAYDMVRLAENLPDNNPNTLNLPDSIFLRPTVIATFDSLEDTVTIVTPVWPGDIVDANMAYNAAEGRLLAVVKDFDRALPPRAMGVENVPSKMAELQSNCSKEKFHNMVKKAVEYIKAGDVFQVVPSQRFRLPFKLPPFTLYRSLRRLNPSPFLFFLDFDDFSIVGSSPEILVRVRDGEITLRPLAGTRKRGADVDEDKALAADLLSDPKERAEHLMLLDLGRNDVGRVAKIGTVKPTEQFMIEYYSHVMHIASNVVGELDDEKYDAIDALLAGFPAGTVSGAPKVRAMEIIDELEPERRGVYGGCIGYFGADGDMDTCIALRTAIIKNEVVYIQAGGGVVADSDPEFEYQESINKAKALIRATQDAVRFDTNVR
jgi:anthranilate synthase component 1